jgi:two-component system chemotaxis response regulator CheB
MPVRRIVVVGASAGGVESLSALVASLAPDLDAALFIVLHIPPNQVSRLPQILNDKGALAAKHPADGEEIHAGRIYVAPPDHHLLVQDSHILVTRGPKENRHRPSIDALFRSAAYCYREQVIGIVLSGALDDGTSGLWNIKRMGGIAITQEPSEAAFDSMPSSALAQVEVDYCLSASKMGPLLERLIAEAPKMRPDNVEEEHQKLGLEVSIATDGDAFEKGVMHMGPLTPFTCPECQGVLVEIREGTLRRFRCHTGHAYSSSALLSSISDKVDESYWAVMRSLEEAAMLLEKMANDQLGKNQMKTAALFQTEAQQAREQAHRLRTTVLSSKRFSGDTLQAEAEAEADDV